MISAASSPLLDRIAQARTAPDAPESRQLKQSFEAALTNQLVDTVGGMVVGWSAPHVEKPAFNYQVDKQAARFSPQAAAQASQNMVNVTSSLTNPQVASMILLGVEEKLDPQGPPSQPQDISDPEFRGFYDSLRKSASHASNFQYEGTLVNVGWGNGDHVNVTSSHLPSGPKTTSGHLAHEVTQALFAPRP